MADGRGHIVHGSATSRHVRVDVGDWWGCRYRLRLNGRWLSPGRCKYVFYKMSEILEVIKDELS